MGALGLGLVSALTQGLPCHFFAHPSSEALIKNRFIPCSKNQPVKLKKTGKKEHHLWMRRELTRSGQKALHLVQIVRRLPNEKEVIYGALDKWTAWETEFPLIAAAKALEILRKRRQWRQIIQAHTRSVSKRLFSRMLALYEHHHLPDKILEIFANMEELGVTPDEDTVTRIGRAFEALGQNDNQDLLFKMYRKNWRYLHFKGECVKVRASEYWNNK